MILPQKRHQSADPSCTTTIKKPTRRRVINSDKIQTHLAHEGEIHLDLLGPPKIISIGVRLERTVSDTLNKELFVLLEKEFRSRSNSRVWRLCHVKRSLPLLRDRCLTGLNQGISPSLRVKLQRGKRLRSTDKIQNARMRDPRSVCTLPKESAHSKRLTPEQLRGWNFHSIKPPCANENRYDHCSR